LYILLSRVVQIKFPELTNLPFQYSISSDSLVNDGCNVIISPSDKFSPASISLVQPSKLIADNNLTLPVFKFISLIILDEMDLNLLSLSCLLLSIF